MKRIMTTLAALLVCGGAFAGQLATTWTLRNVVDPPDLRDGLNADAQAADARLDAIETETSTDMSIGGSFTAETNITATAGNIQATAGTVFSGVGFDAVGAVDLDIGSSDVTDVTVTTDGGTVVLDGGVTASGTVEAYAITLGGTNGVSATITGATNLDITLVGGIITAITSN